MSRFSLFALLAPLLAVPTGAAPIPKAQPTSSWPMFGGTPARNMAHPSERLAKFPKSGPDWEDAADVKKWEAEWILWKADLGGVGPSCRFPVSASSPVVAGGRVYIGTNNQNARNPRDTRKGEDGEVEPIDKGVLMCFEEKTGRLLWQAVHDKLPDDVNDGARFGVTSTPAVVGNRVYYVSNQCRVVCASVTAAAKGDPKAPDADVVWEYDMVRELKVFPHDASNCSPLVVGDRLFVCTGNGVDESHLTVPAPDAPALICLDRHTGKLLWKDDSPGKDVMHGQWSSPSYSDVPVPQVIHGQGDGLLRAFDPATGKLLWKFDGNRKGASYELGGTGDRSDFLAAPVVCNGRVYVGTGQAATNSSGIAHLWCVDLKKAVELGAKVKDRDVSPDLLVRVEKGEFERKVVTKANPASALAWVHGGEENRKWAPRDFKFGRTLSTVAVVDDIVYATELHGYLHCLDAKTGEMYWQYDTRASIRSSPFYVEGKVLVTTEAGDLFVFRHAVKPKKFDGVEAAKGAADKEAARALRRASHAAVEKEYLLARVEFPMPICSTPAVVNGVLFVATENRLYALKTK